MKAIHDDNFNLHYGKVGCADNKKPSIKMTEYILNFNPDFWYCSDGLLSILVS